MKIVAVMLLVSTVAFADEVPQTSKDHGPALYSSPAPSRVTIDNQGHMLYSAPAPPSPLADSHGNELYASPPHAKPTTNRIEMTRLGVLLCKLRAPDGQVGPYLTRFLPSKTYYVKQRTTPPTFDVVLFGVR